MTKSFSDPRLVGAAAVASSKLPEWEAFFTAEFQGKPDPRARAVRIIHDDIVGPLVSPLNYRECVALAALARLGEHDFLAASMVREGRAYAVPANEGTFPGTPLELFDVITLSNGERWNIHLDRSTRAADLSLPADYAVWFLDGDQKSKSVKVLEPAFTSDLGFYYLDGSEVLILDMVWEPDVRLPASTVVHVLEERFGLSVAAFTADRLKERFGKLPLSYAAGVPFESPDEGLVAQLLKEVQADGGAGSC